MAKKDWRYLEQFLVELFECLLLSTVGLLLCAFTSTKQGNERKTGVVRLLDGRSWWIGGLCRLSQTRVLNSGSKDSLKMLLKFNQTPCQLQAAVKSEVAAVVSLSTFSDFPASFFPEQILLRRMNFLHNSISHSQIGSGDDRGVNASVFLSRVRCVLVWQIVNSTRLLSLAPIPRRRLRSYRENHVQICFYYYYCTPKQESSTTDHDIAAAQIKN